MRYTNDSIHDSTHDSSFQESVKKDKNDSEDDKQKKMVASHNWKVLEKENKPSVMAPVFKGAKIERKKGKAHLIFSWQTIRINHLFINNHIWSRLLYTKFESYKVISEGPEALKANEDLIAPRDVKPWQKIENLKEDGSFKEVKTDSMAFSISNAKELNEESAKESYIAFSLTPNN